MMLTQDSKCHEGWEEYDLGLQHKVLRIVTRIAEVARSVAKEARRGERVQQQRGCDFREMRREKTNLVSSMRARRRQKLVSEHHVSNLHSTECTECYLRCPALNVFPCIKLI